jgi:hypothetical protein
MIPSFNLISVVTSFFSPSFSHVHFSSCHHAPSRLFEHTWVYLVISPQNMSHGFVCMLTEIWSVDSIYTCLIGPLEWMFISSHTYLRLDVGGVQSIQNWEICM